VLSSSAAWAPVAIGQSQDAIDFIRFLLNQYSRPQEMRRILAQAEGLEQVADCARRRPFVAD
jgi:hypothetical protein